MLKRNFKLIATGLAIALLTGGCSISFNTGGDSGTAADGGVYRSLNKGNTWQQRVLIPTVSGRPRSFGSVDASSLALDPSDNKAIYLGSVENGLFYSYDGADNWQIANSLGKVTVNNVAIDPSSKCIIYTTVGNKLFKSTDCNRSWVQTYFDNDLNVAISALAIDNFNAAIVYIGTSRGEIIKSGDRGSSWQTLNRFNNQVSKIVISPADSRVIFVGTKSKGIFRSSDGGNNWADLSDKLKDFDEGSKFQDLVISAVDKPVIFLATRYGLLKSIDNGDSWKKIELITPEEKATINSLAVSPKSSEEIYYATNTTFYRSVDGGQNWTAKKLPSSRAGWCLQIDPKNENLLYLAVRKVK